ncbi:DUF1254 domain-containing protein [Novosphingobium aerophilum]|uniref:DUF1254 domain-containing protein n=1 Tax=Novosphingobium aerophilum TaxID=2839843 RepID=UPI003FD377A0
MSSGWEALNAAIGDARGLVAATAPDPDTAAEGQAYVNRMVAAALGGGLLGHHFRAGGLTRALPVHGGPNPDYLLYHAAIDPAGRYRLSGILNGSERVSVSLFALGRNGAPLLVGHAAFAPATCPDGTFAIDLAPDAAGPHGLAIPPEARIVMCRILHRDTSLPAALELASDNPAPAPALAPGNGDEALVRAAGMLRANLAEYLQWTAAALELQNRLDTAPRELAETVQGDGDTRYFLGGFDLAEHEWLEVTMPPGLRGYWSLHVYSYWYEHLQRPGVHDRNAVVDPDGRVRIAVGPGWPADARNRIDTAGRRKGAFICRIVGKDQPQACPQTGLHRKPKIRNRSAP